MFAILNIQKNFLRKCVLLFNNPRLYTPHKCIPAYSDKVYLGQALGIVKNDNYAVNQIVISYLISVLK